MINIPVKRHTTTNPMARFTIAFVVKTIPCVLCELCEGIKCTVVEKVVGDAMVLVLSSGSTRKSVVFDCDGGVVVTFCLLGEVTDSEKLFLDTREMLIFPSKDFGLTLALSG